MSETTDVLIVGAGPAGLSLAYNLGKHNINAIIVDQKNRKKVGYKPCGDALSPNSTRKLFELCGIKQPYGEEVCEDLFSAHFKPMEDVELSIPFRSQTIDRWRYGQRLLDILKDYPWIKFYGESKVVGTIVEDNKVVGCKVKYSDGKVETIYAKIVADCSGATAIVRKNFPEGFAPKIPRSFKREEIIISYREIIETPEPHPYQHQMRIETHDSLPPPGYFWIFSKGERVLNIGLGWLINEKNKKINAKRLLQQLREEIFPGAKVLDGAGDTLPGRLPLYSLVANGFITCGDAGGLVNPISGEGHGPALISAYYAAQTIAKALKEGRTDEEVLWEYNVKIWNTYGYDGALGIAVQKLLNAVPFSDFAFLFKKGIISQKDVDAIMDSTAAKIPVVSKAIKLLQKPSLLIKVAKTLRTAEKLKKVALSYPTEPKDFDKWLIKLQKIENKRF